MDDYIKRGDVLKSICYGCNTHLDCKKNPCADYARLRDIPIIDVRENVHAHWVNTDGYHVKCSHCRHEYHDSIIGIAKFCPNCGAIMDEKKD